ncbi:phosphoserine phosphatase SerB [Parvibaculum sedimenti]|uniref:Phosphoserine phosphatase n=1 Tax=Parvibaculum sedimenti TaxID=2608632 RepID=A0A6N6VJ66_9HYPH|nr:phosphoserine phosphatase SerB [Parvibaculum sedimenti]KAB7738959.1 phosphoserine phosphatase SerB [Parvibaculum sedimenti]
MKYTLTLIGNSATALTETLVAAAGSILPSPSAPDWLAPGAACDLHFEAEDGKSVEATIRARFSDTKIDLSVQVAGNRKKGLLVADMDSTIIQQECIDELAAELGIKDRISAITERAMRGEIAFEPALKERVGLLKGLPLASLEKVYAERIVETPGGRALVSTMRANGATCALVSGGFTFFTERVAAAVGFNLNRANTLIFADGKLTGEVGEPILGRYAKIESLVNLREELKLTPHATMAVGDGANDLGMIEEAGLGVAFHAKPVVAEAADARIDHGDLTALLYLQGYHREEIRG